MKGPPTGSAHTVSDCARAVISPQSSHLSKKGWSSGRYTVIMTPMSKIHHKVPLNPFKHLEESGQMPVQRTRRETIGPLFGAVCALCRAVHATEQDAHECEVRDRDQLGDPI